jgi:hypothetical protein
MSPRSVDLGEHSVRVAHALLLPALVAGALASVPHQTVAPTADRPSVLQPRSGPARSGSTLTVTTTGLSGVPRVSGRLDGANPRWLGNADGLLTSSGTIDAARAGLLATLGLRSLRYPGGTGANLFDYRRFDADPSTRLQCQTSGGFVRPAFSSIARSSYSPALNAQLTSQVGAVTNLMLPMVNTTTGLAEGLVDAVRAGQRAPLYVEVGNEPYLRSQRYWRSADDATGLRQYIHGGVQTQDLSADYPDNDGLFAVSGCDLLHPVAADGTANQTYRPRFWPIATGPGQSPTITVAGLAWQYVDSLAASGPTDQVFTLDSTQSRVVFGDGVHGAVPDGTMTISYAVRGLGFADLYPVLEQSGVKVCASWGRAAFVPAMGSNPYDCLTYHAYANGVGLGDDTLGRAYAALRSQVADRVRVERDLTRAIRTPDHRDRFLMVTEYGTLNSLPGQSGLHYNDLLLAQQMLGQVWAGVRVANLSNLQSLLTTVDGTPYLTSRARLLQLVHDLAGQKPTVVYATGAEGVQVLATRVRAVTRMIVLNQREGRGHYGPMLRIPRQTRARCIDIRRLTGPLRAPNAVDPGTGLPATASLSEDHWNASGSYRAYFPNHSVTSLTVRPRPARGCVAPTQW